MTRLFLLLLTLLSLSSSVLGENSHFGRSLLAAKTTGPIVGGGAKLDNLSPENIARIQAIADKRGASTSQSLDQEHEGRLTERPTGITSSLGAHRGRDTLRCVSCQVIQTPTNGAISVPALSNFEGSKLIPICRTSTSRHNHDERPELPEN